MAKNHQKILIGVALAAGLIGTLTTVLRFKRNHRRGWMEQVKHLSRKQIFEKDLVNKKMILGGVAGGIIAATTALLLAPKSGRDLIKDWIHPIAQQLKQSRHLSSKKNASRSTSRPSVKKSSAKKKETKRSPPKKTTTHPHSSAHKIPLAAKGSHEIR